MVVFFHSSPRFYCTVGRGIYGVGLAHKAVTIKHHISEIGAGHRAVIPFNKQAKLGIFTWDWQSSAGCCQMLMAADVDNKMMYSESPA